MQVCIDFPRPGAVVDPLAIKVEGWVNAGNRQAEISRIEVRIDDVLVGETALLFCRSEVNAVRRLPRNCATGFSLLGYLDDRHGRTDVVLRLVARFRNGTAEEIGGVRVRLGTTDYREQPYGVLLQRHALDYRTRDQIYGSGPSQVEPDRDCLEFVRRHLGPPPVRVLDIGCGLASYGRSLRTEGYDWFGVEIDAGDCAALASAGMPHRQISGNGLPFPDASFAAAMCLDVLEHVEKLEAFLAEARRVAPKILISVPNFEVVPGLHAYQLLPWHMLEGDHKNFFTRWGLGQLLRRFYANVEIVNYGAMPVKTPNQETLFYHLFAIGY